MTTTTIAKPREKTRLRLRPIREVCLVGDPARQYVHRPIRGLRTQDSGLRTQD